MKLIFAPIQTFHIIGFLLLISFQMVRAGKTCPVGNLSFRASEWKVEQESELTAVRFSSDTLEVSSPKGITLWYKQPLTGDLRISYKACVIMQGGPNDRLSDLNSFWMARDPQYADDFFARSGWRKGIFSRYYSLKMYYVGFGGNSNSTSRFRKYDGDYEAFQAGKIRPDVIKEYTDAAHLLHPNVWYDVEIEVKGHRISYALNGEKLFEYDDPAPYSSGYFGFRTVQSHQKITGLTLKKR